MSGYGMTCYGCPAQIDGRNSDEVDRKAVAANWQMGLKDDAQAYYTCPECAPGLFACTPIQPLTREHS